MMQSAWFVALAQNISHAGRTVRDIAEIEGFPISRKLKCSIWAYAKAARGWEMAFRGMDVAEWASASYRALP